MSGISSMHLYLASLAMLLLAIAALAPLALAFTAARPRPRRSRRVNQGACAMLAIACATGFAGAIAGPWTGGSGAPAAALPWGLPFGEFAIALDPLSRIFLLPVFGLGLTCALSGGIALRRENPAEHNLAAHWLFYAVLLLGMAVVVCARDAVLFLLSWELMSLSPFFLIDYNDRDSSVRSAAWTYLTAAHLGAVLLIAFFVALWQISGQTGLDPERTVPTVAHASPLELSALFLLALGGFGAKAGIAPMHVWLPDAHPAAPSHVSALLSGAMINVGLYGLIRALTLLAGTPFSQASNFSAIPGWWGWLVLMLGLCTALIGIVKALGQGNLKRMLAYSSVENMGLMFLGLGAAMIGAGCAEPWIVLAGLGGCLLHMLNHAGFKGLLFLCAGEVLHSTGTLGMDLLGGLQKRLPITGCLFALGAAAIACLPPLSGFAGEFALYLALASGSSVPGIENELGLLLALGCLALVSGLACALYVKAYGIVFLGNPRTSFAAKAHAGGIGLVWPLFIPAAACVAGGLFAPAFFGIAADAALACGPLSPELAALCDAPRVTLNAAYRAIAIAGWAGIGLTLALWLARRAMLGKRSVSRHPTWGCGYQAASARIQYTEGSFSQPLSRIFAPIMGLVRHGEPVSGVFPAQTSLEISAPDRVRNLLFVPLFELVERACNACKIIQHGQIYLYILYILATVVCLLVWGLGS